MQRRAILIAGPTASGKSGLALDLARRANGAIINADSMQMYRDLRIITARPMPEEEALAPHLLFGVVDGAINFSVGCWLRNLSDALEGLAPGKTPIIVGGTGLYFKAALEGLSDIPATPIEVREKIRAEALGRPPEALHAELAAKDPITAARLRPTDPQRILRALEIFEATGRPLASFHGARSQPILDRTACRCVFLAPDRDRLYASIDRRFDAMMSEGALDEVRALKERRLDPALPVMRAHGVPHLIAHLDGRISLQDAIARAKLDTRHYAKRQFTFARHQLCDFRPLPVSETAIDVRDLFEEKPRS
jgi:tRNA dimethylallyltransferase